MGTTRSKQVWNTEAQGLLAFKAWEESCPAWCSTLGAESCSLVSLCNCDFGLVCIWVHGCSCFAHCAHGSGLFTLYISGFVTLFMILQTVHIAWASACRSMVLASQPMALFSESSSFYLKFIICLQLYSTISLCVPCSVQLLSCVRLFVTPLPQYARPSCPSPTPGVYPNSCPLSRYAI